MAIIVIKPSMGVDLVKGLSLGLYGLTRVKPEKVKKNISGFNILYEKKLKNNPCRYRLYML
jgi:hypothetical protein